MPYLTETELSGYFQTIDTLTAENARLTAANDNTNALLDEQGTHINDQALKIAHLTKTHAELTAAHEFMQEDAVQNTYAFGLMLKANKEQAEEIRTLKQVLTDIRATTVTLGDSQSAWKAWRKCSDIAGKALK